MPPSPEGEMSRGEATVLPLRKPSSKGRLDYCEALSTPGLPGKVDA